MLAGFTFVLGWLLTGLVIYFYLPNAPISSGMGIVGRPILRWQYTLFGMGWVGKLFAFGSYFIAGKWWAIGLAIASLASLFGTVVLVAWNWHPKTKLEIIDDLKQKLKELEA